MDKQNPHPDRDRGRAARRPKELPKAGWRDIALRVKQEQSGDHISIIAAGVAFYAMLAIFPALAAAVSIYALVADPAQVQSQIQALSGMMPNQAQALIQTQLQRIVSASGGALGVGVIGGILFALWSANKGTKALLTALDIAYDEPEERGFLKFNGVSLLITVVGIVGAVIALGLVAVLPALLGNLGLSGGVRIAVTWLRWLLLAGGMIAFLAILYRYGPDRDQAQWRWVSWGSVGATALWIIGSILFAVYVNNFGNYNKTYGSLGAVIVLLMWFYLSAYVILLGAELNSEMERQTRRDTTAGPSEPRGTRGAYAADTVGRSPKHS